MLTIKKNPDQTVFCSAFEPESAFLQWNIVLRLNGTVSWFEARAVSSLNPAAVEVVGLFPRCHSFFTFMNKRRRRCCRRRRRRCRFRQRRPRCCRPLINPSKPPVSSSA